MTDATINNRSAKPDWRDREIKKKHAKLKEIRRHNEAMKQVLAEAGIPIPPVPPNPAKVSSE